MQLVYLCYGLKGLLNETLDKPSGVEIDLVNNEWTYLDQTHKIGQKVLNEGPKAARCIGVFDKQNPVHRKHLEHTKELARDRMRSLQARRR